MGNEVNLVIDWIKNYVENSGAKGVVIGNSGGKDSAVVIGLCSKALGKDSVLAIAMPCSSNTQDLEDAKLVADTFGVKMLTINLTNTYTTLTSTIEQGIKKPIPNYSSINIRPRLRMTTLYAIAQTNGYLVAGTGNLCEGFVGYTTKWGDNASDFNPLAEFSVREVLDIGKIIGVPSKILEKAPNDGLGSGSDENKLGVKYSQIEDYIKNGTCGNAEADLKIEKLHKASQHKRDKIPVYKRINL